MITRGREPRKGGSRLLSVPTAAARGGDLSAYGINIYDPQTGQQFDGNRIPTGRLSQQALRILDLIPTPNATGRDNGIRDNYVAAASETFEENSVNVRVDGRLRDNLNIFGRYSIGDFFRDGPTAFGQGGGQELVSLGGVSDVRNHSVALGMDYTISPTMLADFRFGFFKYKVNVLPFDFGTTPAADAGIPGLNTDSTFASGLPAGFIDGDDSTEPGAFEFGSGLGVNRCNCPLDQDEKQFQLVGNLTKLKGSHTIKFGVDFRHAYNLRVPSDAHRSGELTFASDRTSLSGAGGLGLATFLLGDVTRLRRYVSANTDARELQWRHFYYAQDTWRVNSKMTLNYGLRLDIINPQTINEAGNAGFLDLGTGEIGVVGVGDIPQNGGVENKLNWAPRLGATYQMTEKTVLRGGYGRVYDIGVFGSLFGHSVTQNLPVLAVQELNAPSNFDRVFTLASGPPAPTFPTVPSSGRFPLPDGVFARALARQAAAADGRRVQRHGPASADLDDVDRGGVCRQSRPRRVRRRRSGDQHQPGVAERLHPGRAAKQPEAVLQQVRLDAGHRLLLQLRDELLRFAAGEADEAVLVRLFGQRELHAAAGAAARRRSVRDRSARASGPLQQRSRVRAARLGSGPQLRLLAGRWRCRSEGAGTTCRTCRR